MWFSVFLRHFWRSAQVLNPSRAKFLTFSGLMDDRPLILIPFGGNFGDKSRFFVYNSINSFVLIAPGEVFVRFEANLVNLLKFWKSSVLKVASQGRLIVSQVLIIILNTKHKLVFITFNLSEWTYNRCRFDWPSELMLVKFGEFSIRAEFDYCISNFGF